MQPAYKINHYESSERFEVELEGTENAVLIYMIKAGLFIFLHTEVPEPYEGKGIAGAMAKNALEYAREKGFKIRSYCSYITRYIERHPEYQDIVG